MHPMDIIVVTRIIRRRLKPAVPIFAEDIFDDGAGFGDDMTIDPQPPIGGHYIGKVSTIDRAFDSKSGTFGVRLSLPNPDRKLPSGIRCTASK